VDLIENVHLGAPWRSERDLGDEVTDVVDLVVAGGVELVKVERTAVLDVDTALAGSARLAVPEALAVQRLGQDPRRARLAGAPRAAEEIGVAVSPFGDGRLERLRDVRLALDLGEGLRPVAPVEGLLGHGSILPNPDDVLGSERECRLSSQVAARRSAALRRIR
jgi:hypothetical protein